MPLNGKFISTKVVCHTDKNNPECSLQLRKTAMDNPFIRSESQKNAASNRSEAAI